MPGLVPNTPSDALLELAFWAGMVSVLLTLLMALSIVVLRYRLRRAERREAQFLAVWRPALLEVLAGGSVRSLPALATADQMSFLKYWSYLQESLRGSASQTLNQVGFALKVPQFAQQWLRSGRRAERLLAIFALGHLRDKSAWDDLFAQAVSDDSLISLQAVRAMLQIDPVRGVQHLMPLLIKRHDWDINRLAVMLAASRTELEGLLSRKITRVDPVNMGRLMRLAEVLKLNLSEPVLAYLVDAVRPVDILVAGLRLVNRAGLLPQVRAFVQHPNWAVRVQAVKCLGRIGEPADVPLLTTALQDREWWVRYRAAQALAGLPFVTADALAVLRQNSPDRYAQDILGQVFAERMGP